MQMMLNPCCQDTFFDHQSQTQQWAFLINAADAPQRTILGQAITCATKILFTDWDNQTTACSSPSVHALLLHASIVALFGRCLFPDDAAKRAPSVSEQRRDLAWLIEYWLKCFDLWPFISLWQKSPQTQNMKTKTQGPTSHVRLHPLTCHGHLSSNPSFYPPSLMYALSVTLHDSSLSAVSLCFPSLLILSRHSSFPVDLGA